MSCQSIKKNSKEKYFKSVGVEHITKDIKKFIGNKDNKINIFRIPLIEQRFRIIYQKALKNGQIVL